jgi:hypothetical protein
MQHCGVGKVEVAHQPDGHAEHADSQTDVCKVC